MRNWMLVLALVGILLVPTLARAQGEVTLQTLDIQLWPEYDQPSMLVIMDFSVAPSTSLPISLTMRIPARTELLALAREENDNFFVIPSEATVTQGEWKLITFQITDLNIYRIEYYDPLVKNGAQRSYDFTWPGSYAVANFRIKVQEPVGATGTSTAPQLTDFGPEPDGFVYYRSALTSLAGGENYRLSVSYSKANDDLSVSNVPVQPVMPDASGQFSLPPLNEMLPWLFGIIGLLLVAGGGFWYWQSSRAVAAPKRKRKRPARRPASEAGDAADSMYCHQCGKRAQSVDRFCRACGARLRRED